MKANNLTVEYNLDKVTVEVRFFFSLISTQCSISLVVKHHSSKVTTMVRIHNRIIIAVINTA